MIFSEQYRLRNGNQIIGYAEQTQEGIRFCGKFLLWWREGRQSYDAVDRATGMLDKMNRMIYEGDMVYYRINKKRLNQRGIVMYDEVRKQFFIKDLFYKHFTPLFIEGVSLFECDKPEIYSHIFTH